MLLDRIRRFFAALDRPSKLALLAWTVLLLAVSVRVAISPHSHSVYPIFALASQKWLDGEDMYGPTKFDVYRYSPIVGVAFVPLGILPDGLGGILWRMLSVASYLAASGWWCVRLRSEQTAENGSASVSKLGLLFLLSVPLAIDNVNNGQSNMLIIALLFVGVLACGSERWNLAAGCVAVACLFKVYPVAVGMLLTLVYPRRFAGRFVLALVVGLALPFLFQRPSYVLDQYASWLTHMRRDVRQGEMWDMWYRDLRLLCRAWGTPLTAAAYATIQLAGGGIIAVVCLAGRRAEWPHCKLAPLLLGLACCWMTALGPATESSTYLLLAPIASWLVVDAWLNHCPGLLRWFYLAMYLLLVAFRAVNWVPGGRSISMVAQPATALLLFVALLALAVWQLLHSWMAVEPKVTPYPAHAV